MARDNFAAEEKYNNIQEARKHHRTSTQRRQTAYEYLQSNLDAAKSELISFNELYKARELNIEHLEKKPSAFDQAQVRVLVSRNMQLDRMIQKTKSDISRMEREMATLESRGAH